MSTLIAYLETYPTLEKDVFIAEGAKIIGNVILHEQANIWFNAVIRGDADQIVVGKKSNVQDNAVLHADQGDPCIVGDCCVIGHSAIVHGARLANHVLVGMHATILNNAQIGEYSIIGANALVPAGMVIPPFSLVLGVPAKVIKSLSLEVQSKIQNNVNEYLERARNYQKILR